MILLGMGGNLDSRFGSPDQTLAACLPVLQARGIKVLVVSSIWKTEPVPISDQPIFSNAVAVVETHLSPHALLSALREIEEDFGRVRTVRDAARIIDLDILTYNDLVFEDADLALPHPRMHNRGFVLYPLQEVAPGWMHPVLEKSVATMIAGLPDKDGALRDRPVLLLRKEMENCP